MSEALASGREAFEARRWREACEQLRAAERDEALDVEDLHRLAMSAYLAGDACWEMAWSRAYDACLARGETARAARSAFWLAYGHFNAAEMARAGGWLARVQRLVDEMGECAEAGFLLIPNAIEQCERDPQASLAAFRQALAIGERFHDADLIAVARQGEAQSIIQLGDVSGGMALLDEVLVSVTSGELSPIVTGDVYCGAVWACQFTLDTRRAREWTAALNRWCESQPGLDAFRGQCLTYLSAVAQTRGDWPGALEVASQACRRLTEPTPRPAAGAAYYQRAQLERLRGDSGAAEESYRMAAEHGMDPQPGLAQLRLAQGLVRQAAGSIRRVLDERTAPIARSAVLPAYVEIMLAAKDVTAARTASEELREIASAFGSPFLAAEASYATGSVFVAEGKHRDALNRLREAQTILRELDAPYEAARAQVLIGAACRALGDADGGDVEWQAARHVFEGLGAAPDLARMDALAGNAPAAPALLTARELDILRLVATGRTNRAIADELVISEKTVARHVSNIFDKIGVSSRAAATAYAYDHRLLQPATT
ncbi:MAG TPA: LuxR C-terminal-related transcriptional regulator [Dehalococcoidia bacterium]|nr:LuxR C-terminal-related transcriptional regulator [Dehalococcoidia bacterium]